LAHFFGILYINFIDIGLQKNRKAFWGGNIGVAIKLTAYMCFQYLMLLGKEEPAILLLTGIVEVSAFARVI
jgi:hypothetical protein